MPLSETALRSARRSTGSFASAANGRSTPLGGNASGGAMYSLPAALHRGAASTPLLPLHPYHQRSGGSGSGSSQASAEGGSTASAPGHALLLRPAEQHWQAHSMNGWPEAFVAAAHQQPYIQLHVRPVQPSPFVPRMHAVPARPQWGQQQLQQRLSGAEPSADAFWQLHRRSSSIASSGWQQHAEAAQQHKLQVSARGIAANDGGSGHLGSLPSSAGSAPRSAPASAATSPMPSRAPLRGMPSSAPPPPPLTAPAVDLQARHRPGAPTERLSHAWCMSIDDQIWPGCSPAGDPPDSASLRTSLLLCKPAPQFQSGLCPATPVLQVPEAAEDGPDLERFLQAATPHVQPPPSGLQDLTLVSTSAGGVAHVIACALALRGCAAGMEGVVRPGRHALWVPSRASARTARVKEESALEQSTASTLPAMGTSDSSTCCFPRVPLTGCSLRVLAGRPVALVRGAQHHGV